MIFPNGMPVKKWPSGRWRKELSGNNFPIWASRTLVNPRPPIVESAETPSGLSRKAAKCERFVIPTDGKAELRMKRLRTLP
jgi:hypothetical protein